MKKKILAIILAACMTLSFTACGDTENNSETDSSSKGLQENLDEIKENYDSLNDEVADRVDSIKEQVDSIKENVQKGVDSIKDELSSTPLGKVKEDIDDIKEIVSGAKEFASGAKEIKDTIKGEARTPLKSKKCSGEKYTKIKREFELAGFINITVKGNGKLKVGLLHDEGDVETVSIDGKEKFDKDDPFPITAEIVITYYSKS